MNTIKKAPPTRTLDQLPSAAYWRQARRAGIEPLETEPAPRSYLPDDMVVEIGVVPRDDAYLLFADTDEIRRRGLPVGRYGRLLAEHVRALLQRTAVRPAVEGERPSHHIEASLYEDLGHGQSFGNVRGDGRSGDTGQPRVLDLQLAGGRQGQELYVLRNKGVPTSPELRPVGVPEGDGHSTGKIGDTFALAEGLVSAFMRSNGLNAVACLAVAGSDAPYDFTYVLNNKQVPFHSHQGFELLAGAFERIAHLNVKAGRPAELRALLDAEGYALARALGRTRPLSHASLLGLLVTQEAHELADRFWCRIGHGSENSYDNHGLRQQIDVSTGYSVDRSHVDYRPVQHLSPGFGKVAEHVLGNMYAGELQDFFLRTATPDERAAIARLDVGLLASRSYTLRWARDALQHLGLDDELCDRLLRHHTYEVLELAEALRAVGALQVEGATYEMGEGKDRDTVKDPARYDIFSAAGQLVTVASQPDSAERIRRLVQALDPLVPDAERDRGVAEALLMAAVPVVELALAGLTEAQREAAIEIASEQGGRINQPVPAFYTSARNSWSRTRLEALHAGALSQTRLQAEAQALLRDSVRRGPSTPMAVAVALRRDALPVDPEGWVQLARIEENGVCIQEQSCGVRDRLRFAIATDPVALGDPGRYRLEYSLDGERWLSGPPPRVVDGEAVFDVPLQGAPSQVRARFFAADQPERRWDQDGLGFGAGHRPVLGSALVDAELAAYARRQGQRRQQTPAAWCEVAQKLAAALDGPVSQAAALPARLQQALAAHPALTPVGEPYRLENGAVAQGVQDAAGDGGVLLETAPGEPVLIPALLLDEYQPFCRELGLPLGPHLNRAGGALEQRFELGSVLWDPRNGGRVTTD